MISQNYAYQPFEQEKPQKSSKTSKKIVLTLLLILPLIFLLTVLILFIIFLVSQYRMNSTSEISSAVAVTQQLKQDLSYKLFKTFVSATTGTACVTGEEITLSDFSGIEKGCICKQGTEYVKSADSQCTSTSTTCKRGTGIDAQAFKTLYSGKKLCAIYLEPTEYMWGTQAECTAHATLRYHCKSGVCTENLNKCPVNGISWTTAGGPNPIDIETGVNYFYLLRELDTTPIIRLQLGYSSDCLDKIAYPKLTSTTSYPLLGLQYSGCDSYNNYEKQQDSATMQISGIDFFYTTTLTENSIPYASNDKAPLYSDYINDNKVKDKWGMQLIFRPKVGNAAICSSNKGFDNLKNINSVNSTLLKPLYIFTIVGLVLSAVGLLVWIGLIVISYVSKVSKKQKKAMSQYLKLSHIIAILVALFIIFIFIHYMSSISDKKNGFKEGQDGFSKALSTNCYTDTTGFKDAINIVQSFLNFIINTAYPFIITFFILALIYLVLFSILSLICLMSGESPFLPPYAKTSYKQ